MSKSKPNLFIVGAPKCGTTALYDILNRHQKIYCPEEKEIHFFTKQHVRSNYYNTQTPNSIKEYEKLFEAAEPGHRYLADFSPSYMYHPDALSQIHDYNPEAKIIVMLRNPVDRTISHYLMDRSKGFQTAPLEEILSTPDKFQEYFYQYIELSKFKTHVSNCLKVFGKENVLIIPSDNLRSSQSNEFTRIFSFLGIESLPAGQTSSEANSYFEPRLSILGRLRSSKTAYLIYKSLPRKMKAVINNIVMDHQAKKPSLTEERTIITTLLLDDVEFYKHMVQHGTES